MTCATKRLYRLFPELITLKLFHFNVLDCGLPADLPNGRYSVRTDTLTGSIATYSCDNGYILTGDPDVTCLVTGLWEASPTCTISEKNICI